MYYIIKTLVRFSLLLFILGCNIEPKEVEIEGIYCADIDVNYSAIYTSNKPFKIVITKNINSIEYEFLINWDDYFFESSINLGANIYEQELIIPKQTDTIGFDKTSNKYLFTTLEGIGKIYNDSIIINIFDNILNHKLNLYKNKPSNYNGIYRLKESTVEIEDNKSLKQIALNFKHSDFLIGFGSFNGIIKNINITPCCLEFKKQKLEDSNLDVEIEGKIKYSGNTLTVNINLYHGMVHSTIEKVQFIKEK